MRPLPARRSRAQGPAFSPGDRVHLPGVGTGIVREARSGGRYAIDIKGKTIVASADSLQPAAEKRARSRTDRTNTFGKEDRNSSQQPTPAVDLHGCTIAEAVAAVESFVSDALVAGDREVRVVHGRSGGRIRAAVHACLGSLPPVAWFGIDPGNAGVTIVSFVGRRPDAPPPHVEPAGKRRARRR